MPESWLISPAAFWLRSASLRTSAATTAKPLPCSPARAASMAAFRASRLVWRAISSMMEILLAISFIAATASSTDLPLSCASFALLLAILSVCCALSAFCLMLETISSIDDEASSAAAACALAPLDTWTDAVEMDWLAADTSPAMPRMSETVRVSPLTIDASACISLSCGERSRTSTVRLPFEISSAAAVISFMAAISVFRLFLIGVEVAVIGVGDLRRDVALADPVHVAGGEVQRPDDGIQNGVHAANNLRISAAELIGLAALGQFPGVRRIGQPRQLLLQPLQHLATLLTATFIFSWSPL